MKKKNTGVEEHYQGHRAKLWPKYQLSPYYSQGDILPVGDGIPIPPEEPIQEAPDAVLPANLPRIASAIISHTPAAEPTVPNACCDTRHKKRWSQATNVWPRPLTKSRRIS